jgi:hypothetical protein
VCAGGHCFLCRSLRRFARHLARFSLTRRPEGALFHASRATKSACLMPTRGIKGHLTRQVAYTYQGMHGIPRGLPSSTSSPAWGRHSSAKLAVTSPTAAASGGLETFGRDGSGDSAVPARALRKRFDRPPPGTGSTTCHVQQAQPHVLVKAMGP